MFKNIPQKLKKVFKINTESPYYYLSVLVVALLVFGFSFYQAQSNIKEPFKIGMARFAGIEAQPDNTVDLEDVEELKKLDTDGDGLSDYLEIYVYGTSAYIEDTDSDGLSDRIEVVSGANPLCGDLDGCNDNIFSNAPTQQDQVLATYGNEEDLKAKLIELGYVAGDLEGLSTADMIDLYEGTIQVAASSENFANNLYDLSVDDIKSILLNSGVTAEELVSITDEQLMEMYRQALEDNQTTY